MDRDKNEKEICNDELPFTLADILQTENQNDEPQTTTNEKQPNETTSQQSDVSNSPTILPLHTRVFQKVIQIVKNITVEPSIILFTIAIAMSSVMVQSLVMRKICLRALNQTDEVCKNLANYSKVEKEAQELTTQFIMYKTIVESMPSVVIALFVGSWSDKCGRKMLMVVPGVCSFISISLIALNAHFLTEIDVRYIFLASLPVALTGNLLTLMTASFSYVADITDLSSRTIRFSIVQASLLLGAPIGTAISGRIFTKFDYVGVFCTAAVLYLLSAIYVLIFIKETVVVDPTIKNHRFAALFDLTNVREAIKTMGKHRKLNGRFHLFLLVIAVAVSFLPIHARINLTYMYTRLKFSWDEVSYLKYSTTSLVITMLGLLVVLPVMTKILKLKDVTIGILSAVTKLFNEICLGLSTEGWMLYAVSPASILGGMNGIVVRTMMSKIVTREEQGKITAVISSANAAMPTVGSLLFNQVYKATIHTFSGTIYLVSAVFAIIPAVVFIWIYVERGKLIGKSESLHHLPSSEQISNTAV